MSFCNRLIARTYNYDNSNYVIDLFDSPVYNDWQRIFLLGEVKFLREYLESISKNLTKPNGKRLVKRYDFGL